MPEDNGQIKMRGWGFEDTAFFRNDDGDLEISGSRYLVSGKPMPKFIPYISDELGVHVNTEKMYDPLPARVPDPCLQVNDILEAIRATGVSATMKEDMRLRRSHGHTHEEMFAINWGEMDRVPDVVAQPTSEEEVQKLVNTCRESNWCLVPYGGGTNVSLSLKLPPVEKEPRPVVVADMTHMNRVLRIDCDNRTCEVQAGVRGTVLDKVLRRYGFVSGHEPDSNEFSTVGGWVATAASGMKQNAYGNIEDIVMDVRMVLADGTVLAQEHPFDRSSSGFDTKQVTLGSEGNLGIITSARLRVRPVPAVQKFESVIFYKWEDGLKFLKTIQDSGIKPASVRLIDNDQFRFGQAIKPQKVSFWSRLIDAIKKFFVLKVLRYDPFKMCACTLVFEGSAEAVAAQLKLVKRVAKENNAMMGGGENGRDGYNLTYAIAYIRDAALRYHIMAESFETTVPWSKIPDVYREVRKVVEAEHARRGLPGKPYLTHRISQIYPTSVCMYFYYAFSSEGVENAAHVYSEIERKCRNAIMDTGGSISHHHGVGKIRASFNNRTHTEHSKEIFQSLKKSLDPDNVFGIKNGVLCESVTN
jgi:alkyldihydroxyacetonephosphate synthase